MSEESGQKTGSVEDDHWVPFQRGVVGHGKLEVGVEKAEVVEGDMEHSKGVHDD